MSGDPYKKVQPGQRFSFPAKTYNDMIDAIRASKQRGVLGAPKENKKDMDGGSLKVKNTSEANVPWYGVLGVDDILFSPEKNLNGFKNQPVLKCVAPVAGTHEGKFLILQTPVSAGKIGVAMAVGVTPVQIDVTDENHTHADIKDGDVTQLKSAPSGAAQILWKEPGTGTKWAVVRLGGFSTANGFWARIDSEAGLGVYDEWTEQKLDSSGGFVDADNPRTEADGILVEVNATEGIATGTYVWVREEIEADGEKAYRFSINRTPIPAGWYQIDEESETNAGEYELIRMEWDDDIKMLNQVSPEERITGVKEVNYACGIPCGTIVWCDWRAGEDDEGDPTLEYTFQFDSHVHFYKALADYSTDDGTITANECSPGGEIISETVITCYIESPWSYSTYMSKRDAKIRANQVLAGLPFGVNKAMLLPLPPNVPDAENAYVLVAKTTVIEGIARNSFEWIAAGDKYSVLTVTARKPQDDADNIKFDGSLKNELLDGENHTDTWDDETDVQRGDLVTGQVVGTDNKWKRLAKGGNYSICIINSTGDVTWLSKGDNGSILTVNNSGALEWKAPPSGPAVLCYDATSGVHWLAMSGAYHGAFRSASSTMESTPQKATS